MTGQAEPFGPFMEKWTRPSGEVQLLFHCPGCGDCTHELAGKTVPMEAYP